MKLFEWNGDYVEIDMGDEAAYVYNASGSQMYELYFFS